MAMNYEFERHIRFAQENQQKRAVDILRAQRDLFNALVDAGVVQELPREWLHEMQRGGSETFSAGVPPPPEQAALTISEAAKALGVSLPKMRRLIRSKSIPTLNNPLDNRQRLVPVTAVAMLARSDSYSPAAARRASSPEDM